MLWPIKQTLSWYKVEIRTLLNSRVCASVCIWMLSPKLSSAKVAHNQGNSWFIRFISTASHHGNELIVISLVLVEGLMVG